LTWGIAGSDERIEARYTLRDTSGKEQTITLGSYDRKQIDLKIVPVKGATVPANLAQQINVLYKYQWDYIHDPQTMLFAWA
jgi:hypothetical protein